MPDSAIQLPVLHHRFRGPESFRPAAACKLLPFRWTALDDRRVVVTNMVGEFVVTTRAHVEELVQGTLSFESDLFAELVSKHIVLVDQGQSALDLLATKYRTKLAWLSELTALHLFVVTLRCDHSCPYCQVSRVSSDHDAFDMSPETAVLAVEAMFASPSRRLKVEIQGGEPLLNWGRIVQIVELVEAWNRTEHREIAFVIATNLSQLTDEMLWFMDEHRICVSTSLDGPSTLHNANRPRPGNDSYQRAVAGIARCRSVLGEDRVSALMTTTAASLECPEQIIDEYVRLGFRSVFLRWLSPFGFARKTGRAIGYPTDRWNRFYETGLRHILALCHRGMAIREEYASIILRKMLTPYPTGYVDLQSPSGLGLSVLVYNYDGYVYASDEGRMLAELGDLRLRLGHLSEHAYQELMTSDGLVGLLMDTMTEGIPGCSDCAFEPWCGTDPAFHLATQDDPVGHRPTSAFCHRNMFVFRLLTRIWEDEPEHRTILESWL